MRSVFSFLIFASALLLSVFPGGSGNGLVAVSGDEARAVTGGFCWEGTQVLCKYLLDPDTNTCPYDQFAVEVNTGLGIYKPTLSNGCELGLNCNGTKIEFCDK